MLGFNLNVPQIATWRNCQMVSFSIRCFCQYGFCVKFPISLKKRGKFSMDNLSTGNLCDGFFVNSYFSQSLPSEIHLEVKEAMS